MAQIYKRSGKWSVRIQWKDTEGKRFSKSKAGFATKALAKKWAAEMETNLNRGIHIEKKIAFSDYYEEWVNTYVHTGYKMLENTDLKLSVFQHFFILVSY